MHCPSCGAEASGNFCSSCGASLLEKADRCAKCGAALEGRAAFCEACGEPTGPRAKKPVSAQLPWILSFVALAAFSLAIAWFVQNQSRVRVGDDPITGGLPESGSGPDGSVGGAPGPAGGVTGLPDLSSMSPREAADRLFDRAMREAEAEDDEQAAMFANMALRAYAQVPPEGFDLDALFHVGLLHLLIGDADTARTIADGILANDESHLLALVLARRASAAAADTVAAAGFAARLRDAVEAGELETGRTGYEAHRGLIEREAGVATEAQR